MLKLILASVFALLTCVSAPAAEPSAKLPVKVGDDGFPAGSNTPEGAACDLARAFIHCDTVLFLSTCLTPYGSTDTRDAYTKFLDGVALQMKEEAGKPERSPEGPKTIRQCFAARHLSKDGPASYGYAAFGFQDIMFVDVNASLNNGQTRTIRTLVIKNEDGKWIVHPRPDLSPLLSMGLNEESKSEKDFTEVYVAK